MLPVHEIRCSGLSRPMNCAGFLFMKDLPPQETNDAAKEGTACGELLEHMLTNRTLTPQVKSHAANGVLFDSDMWYYARIIAEKVLNSAGQSPVLCETRIDWPTESGITIRGQYDISYTDANTLYIEDLKYGWRILNVKENWQLLGYSIGEVRRLYQLTGWVPQRIIMRIHQPRPFHDDGMTRTWEITYQELAVYWKRIEERLKQIAQGFSELATGAQCKYCPAASSCSALNRALYEGIEVIMSDAEQDHLSDEALSKQLDILDRAMEIAKIKKDSLEQLAVNRIRAGAIVPNYAIEEKHGDRKWKREVSPEVIKMLTGKDIIEKTMMSPAKAEKLGIPKELTMNLTERHRIGVKVSRQDSGEFAKRIFG